jgi:hypothetical protein
LLSFKNLKVYILVFATRLTNEKVVVDSEMSASLLQVLKQNNKDMSDEEVELKRKIDQ